MNHARVRSGMMFAAVPPSWMIPWTRQWVGSCWRHRPTETNSAISASSAFRAFHGSDAAWAPKPVNVTWTSSEASGAISTWSRSHGWYRSAASSPSNSALADHDRLAAPPLLRGRAEEHDLAGPCVADRGQRDRRTDPRRRHRVVAAAVAEARQRVVLGEDPDPRAVRPEAAGQATAHGRVQASRPAARRRSRGGRWPRRPTPRPGAPRTRARGSRGCGARGRGSRRGRPRPRRRRGP